MSSTLSLSPITIAGIVIGVVAGLALFAGACLYLRRSGGSRGSFARLRKARAADPEEEFMSRGLSTQIRDRGGYGHNQQPSVSLEPLIPSPPVSGPSSLRDGSSPLLPPIDLGRLTLYDTDDPYARIERAILTPSRAHHAPVSSRRQSDEFGQLSGSPPRRSGPSPPLFINRPLTRPLGSEFSLGRIGASPLSSQESLPYTPPRTASGAPQLSEWALPGGDTGNALQSKPRVVFSTTAVAEERPGSYSQVSTPHNTDRRSRSSFRRLPSSPKLRGLSPVAEGSTMADVPPSNDTPANTEIMKHPSLPALSKSSSLSVALSHTGHLTSLEPSSFPLLSSNDAFGKTDSSSSSQRWTSTSSGRATRYPSLAPSSVGLSSSNSNHHSDSAPDWRCPPAGLAALKNIQLDTPKPGPSSDQPPRHTRRPSMSPADNRPREEEPQKARLRAHAPGSLPEVERKSIVQGGIASIDVSL